MPATSSFFWASRKGFVCGHYERALDQACARVSSPQLDIRANSRACLDIERTLGEVSAPGWHSLARVFYNGSHMWGSVIPKRNAEFLCEHDLGKQIIFHAETVKVGRRRYKK